MLERAKMNQHADGLLGFFGLFSFVIFQSVLTGRHRIEFLKTCILLFMM